MPNKNIGNTIFKIGDKVTANGGYPGTVIDVPSWAPGMITVRLSRGTTTIPKEDAQHAKA